MDSHRCSSGENPLEVERLWYRMYRGTIYFGRRGAAMQAISAIDIALWDICGKAYEQPVHILLGGKWRDRVRAYGSTLFRPTPEAMRESVKVYLDQGFTAVKFGWGVFGKDRWLDVKLVEAAREALGSAERPAGGYRLVRRAHGERSDPGRSVDRAVPAVLHGRTATSGRLRRLPESCRGDRCPHRVRRAGGHGLGFSDADRARRQSMFCSRI